MSLAIPEKNWYHPPSGAERLWIGVALVWCFVMSLMMPYWHFTGKQNTRGETYKVTPADYAARVDKFVASTKTGEYTLKVGGQPDMKVPIASPAPGTDAYLLAKMWTWSPVLKLRKGETYKIHLSSMDLQHGFSLQPLNMNFQALPGYDFVLTMTPTSAGEFTIVCNEFCGIGHDRMVGKILVEE
jgi:cytochrome c oxidase subunit 2